MLELDPSKLAPKITTLLLSRGSGVPPLDWRMGTRRETKAELDAIDDATLFGGTRVVAEDKAMAVRALLYLWSGWIDDCRMYAVGAAAEEQHFLIGLCERQLGHVDAAKAAFRQFSDHPIYASLRVRAAKMVGTAVDAALGRFMGIVEIGEAWEPFAFVDLCEQTRAGTLSQATTLIVRSLQCIEFEQLFGHVYEGATGQHIFEVKRAARNAQRVCKRKPVAGKKELPKLDEPARPEGRAAHEPDGAGLGSTTNVDVKCPKCRHTIRVAGSDRGKPVRCGKCGTPFMIPTKISAFLRPSGR